MATPRKKIPCEISIDDPISSDTESELELGEDEDELELNFSGTLTFNSPSGEELAKTPQVTAIDTGYVRPCDLNTQSNNTGRYRHSGKIHTERTNFEIISAKTVGDGHSKYVAYTVAVVRSIGADSSQALIERRYSEFYTLNQSLRKKFPELMQNIAFPRKTITGNFKLQTIAERSRAFEQYLSHIFTFEDVRTSPEFEDFFYNRDLQVAYKYLCVGEYQEAIPVLQNALHLEEKLLGETHPNVIETLSALVVAYCHIDSDAHAHSYAKAALDSIIDDSDDDVESNVFLVPLLRTAIGICWRIGKDKRHLEMRLSRNVKDVFDAESRPALKELVLRRFMSHTPPPT
ncbi:sorting nexin-21-like [Saccoglossus kowalevskii]|uniref:Sorting nexin-21-like n=1 Tax=Saccoglossus kowalevskii TaxID=10224 RepID=A0ABM0GJW1_SACKO|nr:PREDICTED: sorting nexin-21-like [Saccoglossus kowalevskii]